MRKFLYILLFILVGCSPNPFQAPLATTTARVGIPQVSIYNCVPSDMGQFDMIIASHGRLSECESKIGLIPLKYEYLIGDRLYGPQGLVTPSQQKTLCTTGQKSHDPASDNNVTQAVGEFCLIHDAIINKTPILGLYPTESFFLHKPNGDRYCATSGTSCMYRPNPSDQNWRKYFAYTAKRLLGTNGLFIDNLNASFSQITTEGNGVPRELGTNDLYDSAMVGFVSVVKGYLGSTQITGNLNDMSYTPIWDAMAPYLDGGMSESWGNTWSGGKPNLLEVERDLDFSESWLESGKSLQLVYSCGSLSNCTADLQRYGVGLYYLIAHRGSGATYFAGLNGVYSAYTSVPEYYLDLGIPLETRRKLGSIYERCFTKGSVRVDISNRTATFGAPCPISVTETSTPTITPTPTWEIVTIVTDTPPATITNTPTVTPTGYRIFANGTPVPCPKPCRIDIP